MSSRNDRQEEIRDLLTQRGRLSVEELAETLQVTTMTIRRDLAAMEQDGMLTRTHGGCVLQSPFVNELPFTEKDQQRQPQKLAIAREAAKLLTHGQRVYLDTGTTAVHVARVLPGDLELSVLTNNLRVATELFGRKGIEVIVYGGRLAGQSPDLVGELALTHITESRIDVALMGADAVDPVRGEIYSADLGTALLSRAVRSQADRTILLADSSKFGRHSLDVVGRLGESATLVTDWEATPEDLAHLRATGAEVLVAVNGIQEE
ncbi:MAG: DeoR/GlpR transcriptional regulator [Pirellulales bacterium]|nr:DeoR/GlpR transcriptional regulator [Pirellulales bacterium]